MAVRRNPPRSEARAAGARFYCEEQPCALCGCPDFYTSNGYCVDCTKTKASARYAALDEVGLVNHKQRDHARYLRRLARSARDDA
jgi:hypothetical protein